MRIFTIIKETMKAISSGLSLTVLERGNYVERAFIPGLNDTKK